MWRTRSERTYFAAKERNPQRARLKDLSMPERVLAPDEAVYDVLICSVKNDEFPLLLVTDRRVVYTEDGMFRRWRVVAEAPAPAIAGAELEEKLLSFRVHLHLRDGERFTAKTGDLRLVASRCLRPPACCPPHPHPVETTGRVTR
ncbi:MAG: PH domain-containing protein [Actinomycetaceae bacterium]